MPIPRSIALKPHSIKRPIRTLVSFSSDLVGAVNAFQRLDGALFGAPDFTNMANLYRHVKVNWITIRAFSGVPYLAQPGTQSSVGGYAYNPGVYAAPGALQPIFDLEDFAITPITCATLPSLSFKPQYDVGTVGQDGSLSLAISASSAIGSLQVFFATSILSQLGIISFMLTYDCTWSGIN